MKKPSRLQFSSLLVLASFFSSQSFAALPAPDSKEFCVEVQKILANTEVKSENEIFDNMPDYRASKPSPKPLKIYQVVSYEGNEPIAVSCKVKAVDHLQEVYGESAARDQGICADVTRLVQQQAVEELISEGNTAAAEKAGKFIIDNNEPFYMGKSYLESFPLTYQDQEGIHFNSPGLQTDWNNRLFYLLPKRLRGQTYCHLATVGYMKAVAKGTIPIGTVLTTADDAPTTPK